jgi:uncharacterized membrane protein
MRILTTAALVVLGACSREEGASPEAPPASEAAPVFDGLDMARPVRLIGTEPFWSVDLTGSEVIYTGVDRPELRAPQPLPQLQGTVAVLETQTAEGLALTITLTATECSDGMSDRTYPVTAVVKAGQETLLGCAAPTDAFKPSAEADGSAARP